MELHILRALLSAAEDKARDIGIRVATCIVDRGGNLAAFERMPGTQLASSVIAQGKAYTALAWERPSGDLYAIAQPGVGGFGINTIDPRFVLSPSGIPLGCDGMIVGAIGVSGGTGEQDTQCAQHAAALYGQLVIPPEPIS